MGFKDLKSPAENLKESYFTFNNPTVGTGIALNADPTAISATESCLIIDNSGTRTNGDNQSIHLDYIRLTCTDAGTGATSARLAFYIDNINRYSSGGQELTGKSTSYDTTSSYTDRTPKAKVYFGDLTATSESSAKHIATRLIKNDTTVAPCFAVDDVFTLKTDSTSIGGANYFDSEGVVDSVFSLPPIYIYAGCSLIVAPLFPSQSASASFEIEVGLIENGHRQNS
jgi:hypothetical protein